MEAYVDDMLVKSKSMSQHVVGLKETFSTLKKYRMRVNPMKYAFGVTLKKIFGFIVSYRGIGANQEKI